MIKIIRENQNPQTQTPEFKRWFGNSKVVDDRGNPLVVYHGTNGNITSFSKKSFRYNGIYLTTKYDYAKYFGNNVLPLYVRIENPYIFDMEDTSFSIRGGFEIDNKVIPSYRDMTEKEISLIRTKGYDGIIVNVPKEIIRNNYGSESIYWGFEIVAFHPNQIKSATDNNGDFDPRSNNIHEQRDSINSVYGFTYIESGDGKGDFYKVYNFSTDYLGMVEYSRVENNYIEIDRMYLQKEWQKQGVAQKIIWDILNHENADGFMLYPLDMIPWIKMGMVFQGKYLYISKQKFQKTNSRKLQNN